MLITKSRTTRWHYKNKEWFENKNYKFTKYGDEFEVSVGDLPDGSPILVDIECNGCGKVLEGIRWVDYKRYVHKNKKYYCQKCSKNGYEKWISFYEWCYTNLSEEEVNIIILRWDYEKNIDKNGKVISPKDIGYGSKGLNNKGYWFKCLDHPEHKSEQKSINNFTNGHKGSVICNQCNSISITAPYLVAYLVNKEDALKYSVNSNEKILMKCPKCDCEKQISFNTLTTQGFGCPKCSNGSSYPNKFMFNFLEQIKDLNKIKDFETEKTFKWLLYKFDEKLRQGRLDGYFEFNNKKYGLEMDGGFHAKDNNMTRQTKKESQYIDDEKDRLCKEHDVEVIRINSLKSEWQYIKKSIMNSEPNLPQILNFKEEDIDWLKCHEYACSNLIKEVCDLWNSKTLNILKIAEKFKVSNGTITNYLKRGSELDWCNYINYSKIICTTTGEIFNSQREASNRYDLKSSSSIAACCKGKRESAGKSETGEKLKWMYYDEYIKLNPIPFLTAI